MKAFNKLFFLLLGSTLPLFGVRQRITIFNESLEDLLLCVDMAPCVPLPKNTIEIKKAKDFFGIQMLQFSSTQPIYISLSSSLEPNKTLKLMLDETKKNILLMIGNLTLESTPYSSDQKSIGLVIDKAFMAHFRSNYMLLNEKKEQIPSASPQALAEQKQNDH